MDSSAESLLELMELCEEGRQVDLAYPDFHATPGTVPYETCSLDDNQPVKKVIMSFVLLFLTYISSKLEQSCK